MLFSSGQIETLTSLLNTPEKKYRSSFLVQKKNTFIPFTSRNFAYFFIQDGIVRGATLDNEIFSFNEKLEDLENDLNPELFFRANRQYIIQRSAIKSLQTYFNGRMVVNLQPQGKDQIVVSKANVAKLKLWLNDGKIDI